MPVTRLFVEGDLDVELLAPLCQGRPILQKGGTKYALKPRARVERRESRVSAGYLRDRDFDFDPPSDLSQPTQDGDDDGVPMGWRWCRHEIENYLIEPALVSEALGWAVEDVGQAICKAAMDVRHYEAARWTIGVARRALPPHYELNTRPDLLRKKEIALPAAIDADAVGAWAHNCIGIHRDRIAAVTGPDSVRVSLDGFVRRFDDAFCADTANVLLWFSGKDLLAAMAGWLASNAFDSPGMFRTFLRDWVRANPERVLELLPEWRRLVEIVRA